MGGSGGGFYKYDPEELKEKIRKAEQQTKDASFETALSDMLNQFLAIYNSRDAELVKERLHEVLKHIEKEIEGTLDTLYGGSVAKRTYVDGLSDIDSLLLINNTELIKKTPTEVLRYVKNILFKWLQSDIKIKLGNLAITLEYSDGMQIQLLPAVRTDSGFIIPSSNGKKWSEIDPKGFTDALTKWNSKYNNKLVPTIKLIKVINTQFPETLQLASYHIEALAIETFKTYNGHNTLSSMLPHFFDRAKELVLSPIKDKTGQSIHVDDYLGDANSKERILIGHLLNRISKRIKNSSAACSIEQWQSLFGE